MAGSGHPIPGFLCFLRCLCVSKVLAGFHSRPFVLIRGSRFFPLGSRVIWDLVADWLCCDSAVNRNYQITNLRNYQVLHPTSLVEFW
jgi:hypothetical protein